MNNPPVLDLSLQPFTIASGFTQSELSMFDECAFKWNLRYNNLLEKRDQFNWPFFVGTSWHRFQQNWRIALGKYDTSLFTPPEIPKNIPRDSEFEQTLEYWSEVLPTYQKEYAKFYRGEETLVHLIIEKELSAEFLGFKLRGMLDLAYDKSDKRYILDFKSTSSAWLISPNGWHFKLQFMLYCWLMIKNYPGWKGKQFEFKLDIMQKPGLKQTQKENWAQHIQRVQKDIASRPEYYFTRQTQLITPDAIERFELEVLTPKLERLIMARDHKFILKTLKHLLLDSPILTNKNTNACNMFGKQCEFFEVCEKGWDAGKFFFEQRKEKHQELV